MNKTIRCRRNAGDDGGCGGMDWYGLVWNGSRFQRTRKCGAFQVTPQNEPIFFEWKMKYSGVVHVMSPTVTVLGFQIMIAKQLWNLIMESLCKWHEKENPLDRMMMMLTAMMMLMNNDVEAAWQAAIVIAAWNRPSFWKCIVKVD